VSGASARTVKVLAMAPPVLSAEVIAAS